MKYIFGILLLFLCTTELSAKIFICIDDKGRKHYSDKRCPLPGQKIDGTVSKLGIANRYGKLEIPDEIKAYTAAIQVIRHSFSVLSDREPANQGYKMLLQLVTYAEQKHTRFIQTPDESRFGTYQPFSNANLNEIVASLSDACRIHGYFSICSAIEGNTWISKEEKRYLSEQNNRKASDTNRKKSCDKANVAHTGGVISDKMVRYFCRKDAQ